MANGNNISNEMFNVGEKKAQKESIAAAWRLA